MSVAEKSVADKSVAGKSVADMSVSLSLSLSLSCLGVPNLDGFGGLAHELCEPAKLCKQRGVILV